MNNNFSPCYHSVQNHAYHIDFMATSSGKRVSGTKRRVRWQFGFSNREAIENGLTGQECRGEEHEVTLIWSLTSGKRMVLFDGVELCFSIGKVSKNKFEFDWSMHGNHTMKIIAYAAPPLRASTNFRQFDLLLDGRSVLDLPKIFELGGVSKAITPRESTYKRYNEHANYRVPAQEEMAWAQTVQQHEERGMIDRSASLQVNACSHPQPKLTQSQPPNMDVAMPSDLISEPTPVVEEQDFVSSPLPIIEQNKLDAQHHSSPELNYYIPTSQAPTFEEVLGKIMDAYDSPPPQKPCDDDRPRFSGALVIGTAGGNSLNKYASDIMSREEHPPTSVIDTNSHDGVIFLQSTTPESEKFHQADSTHNQTNPLEMTPGLAPTEPFSISDSPSVRWSPSNDSMGSIDTKENDELSASTDELGKSIQKLVNIDDIRSPPEEERLAKLSVEPYENSKYQNKPSGASRGLPPTPTAWFMGQNSTLLEIQRFKSPKTSAVQVMKTHTSNPVTEGQMVVYGAHNPLTQGPPPIVHVSGFGVGKQMLCGGFSMNRQAMPTSVAY